MDDQPREQLPPFKIHNRTGASILTLTPAHFSGDTFSTQSGEVRVLNKGYLMIEIANATEHSDSRGNPIYDWRGKVVMKLTDADIHQVLSGLQGESCRIVHDPNKARGQADKQLPKSCLQLSKGERFGYFISMTRGETKVKCPISDTEAATMRLLLRRAVARIYGW